MRNLLQLLGLVSALASSASCNRPENPMVVPELSSMCRADQRLVRDVCTRLGSDDGCVDVDDVCIKLCDAVASCAKAGTLRVLDPWAVAPDGYCVECLDGK